MDRWPEGAGAGAGLAGAAAVAPAWSIHCSPLRISTPPASPGVAGRPCAGAVGASVIEPSALRAIAPACLLWNRVTIERTLSSGLSDSSSVRSSVVLGGAVITMRTVGSAASRMVTLAAGGRTSSAPSAPPAPQIASARKKPLAAAKTPRRELVLCLYRLARDGRSALDHAVHRVGRVRDAARRLDGEIAFALHGERERVAGVALVRVLAARGTGIRYAAEHARWIARVRVGEALRDRESRRREAGLRRHAGFHRHLPRARRNIVGKRSAADEPSGA